MKPGKECCFVDAFAAPNVTIDIEPGSPHDQKDVGDTLDLEREGKENESVGTQLVRRPSGQLS